MDNIDNKDSSVQNLNEVKNEKDQASAQGQVEEQYIDREIEIPEQLGTNLSDDDCQRLIDQWLSQKDNEEFAQNHDFTGNFSKHVEGEIGYIRVEFRVMGGDSVPEDDPNQQTPAPQADKKGEDVSKLRETTDYRGRYGGDQSYNMRSTNFTTGQYRATGQQEESSGQWRSYYAQQREREIAQNQEIYRRDYMRDSQAQGGREPIHSQQQVQQTNNHSFDYRQGNGSIGRMGSGSPLRGQSPTRYEASQEVRDVPQVAYKQTFSLYEQHKEQRDQREHVDYQKIQGEHQKTYEISQLSSGIRDRIINTYRAEIESHKHNERDFVTLQAMIDDIRKRKESLEISFNTLQGDYEAQLNSQQNVVSSLNHELEILRNQNNDKQREGVEVSETTQTVRIEINTEDKNVRDYSHEIGTCVSHNQSLEREVDNCKVGIQQQQEVRQGQQSQIYQSNAALSKWEQECYAQTSRISVLDNERRTLIDRTGSLNEQLNQRTKSSEETSIRIHSAQTDITKLKSMIHGLDLEINNLEKANSMLVEDQKQKLARNSQEYNTAHELTSKLQSLEANYYSQEVDERGKNTDLEAVNYSNQALMDRNLDLKSEYEALGKHSSLLTQQNRDLQRELDSFVETDDIVRRNLDRKEKVDEIRYKVDSAIQQSQTHVYKSRSPLRDQTQNTQSRSPNYAMRGNQGQASQFQPHAKSGYGTSQKSQANIQNVGDGIYAGSRVVSASYSKSDFSPAGKQQAHQYTYKPARGGSPLRKNSGSPGRRY